MFQKIKTALISVSDKSDLPRILKTLKKFKIRIISSGGTYRAIKKQGFDCTEISKYTGFDEIIKKKDGKPLNYNLRFHLYPGLTTVKTMSGNSVLIQLSKNKSLIFTIKNESILLEKSIFLGGNKILDNTCVTVSGNLVNKNKTIHWEIKKNI